MSAALDARIAHVAGITICRFCTRAIPPEAVLCECRIAAGEKPHTEWPSDLKRMLAVRVVERQRPRGMSEQYLWETLLAGAYRGHLVGEGTERRVLSYTTPLLTLYPIAEREAAAWVAAGRPANFTI